MMKFKTIILLIIFSLWGPLAAQTIAEKKAMLKESSSDLDEESEHFLQIFNQEMEEIKSRLKRLYDEAEDLYEQYGPEGDYSGILSQINDLKQKKRLMEDAWRERMANSNVQETYGLWLARETTLEQLVIDYGSQDYVYLIPADVGAIKLSVDSNLPIPRSSWSEMLELILSQNGVGVKVLNPYLRQLYFLRNNASVLKAITNQRDELELLPSEARIGFVLSPEPSEVRRAFVFLEKFVDPNTTSLHLIGRDILVIGSVRDIKDLLKLYDFVATNRGDKEYKLIPLFKIDAGGMAKMLQAIFDKEESNSPSPTAAGEEGPATTVTRLSESNGLNIIALESMAQALFLVGTREEIRKAEEVVRNVESQLSDAREKVVFWYTIKHSDPEELAEILQKVYLLMISTGAGLPGNGQGGPQVNNDQNNDQSVNIAPPPLPLSSQQIYSESFYQGGGYLVNPAPAQPGLIMERPVNQDRNNFIVDMKTGAIVMVVEADILPKLKELIRKLDVPKKMVQIETLLFEKRVTSETNFGLNLLKIGSAASQTNATSFLFNSISTATEQLGISQFLISRKKTDSGIPAFDLAYTFLLSQDDVQINACPSVLAVNQTPAVISIVDEISINTGIFEVETVRTTLKDAFTRAQYGITIEITPSIHMGSEENEWNELDDGVDYVTLDTDVTFDTIQPGGDPNRPDVTRRHITNQVQLPDGQTVVLGGLRRRQLADGRDAIPFIGELPGIGKLCSFTRLQDATTEMFIFITVKIVADPCEDLERLRREHLCRRPGDLPSFLYRLQEARLEDKYALMHNSMRILFGQQRNCYYDADADSVCPCSFGEYDGR